MTVTRENHQSVREHLGIVEHTVTIDGELLFLLKRSAVIE